jgi:hypothetical protein
MNFKAVVVAGMAAVAPVGGVLAQTPADEMFAQTGSSTTGSSPAGASPAPGTVRSN